MENNLKYFVPEISDICIGYELEINWNRAYEEKWVPIKILVQDEEFAYTDELSEIVNALHDGMSEARVPYLIKEQIEAEGWKLLNEDKYLQFVKSDYSISYVEKLHLLIVTALEEKQNDVKYSGTCKDINTFRKIIKLLEI